MENVWDLYLKKSFAWLNRLFSEIKVVEALNYWAGIWNISCFKIREYGIVCLITVVKIKKLLVRKKKRKHPFWSLDVHLVVKLEGKTQKSYRLQNLLANLVPNVRFGLQIYKNADVRD